MWSTLIKKGIPEKIVSLICELYRDAQCRVRFNGKQSRPFFTSSGVRQGCILSPTLFLLLLDSVLETTNIEAPSGIRWTMSERLNDIDYADDLCLMSHRFSDMELKLKRLSINAAKVGLKINYSKTKLMRICAEIDRPLVVDGNVIENVQNFVYLGCRISNDGGSDADISDRINKARASFHKMNKIWRANNLSQKTKIRIFNCSVKSVLLYGCTTWSLTQLTISKIQSFINRCLRKILRIFWPNRISNHELWDITNSVRIDSEIRRRKWTWIGHILRRPVTEIARNALEWNPQGHRRPGRPRNTWIRCTRNEFERRYAWGEIKALANNRSRWREIVNALCSSRT